MRDGKVRIRRAAVLGAGVMGSRIAALLAGADVPVWLLDVVPPGPDDRDLKKGLTRESPEFRSKLARAGMDAAAMASPPAFYSSADARLITPGNLEDNLDWLAGADWVIEAVAEDLKAKTDLMRKVGAVIRPGTIVTTTTSGLSVERIAEGLPGDARAFFLGAHFFNPPRQAKLVEVVPGRSTDPRAVSVLAEFCERRLGRSVVAARDTPSFIANRIGVHALLAVMKTMLEDGYTVEEADAITGVPLCRPRSASLRTADMMGLDVLARVAQNVRDNAQDASEKEAFTLPPLLARMIEAGLLGDRVQKGFYRTALEAAGMRVFTLDCSTMEYALQKKAGLPLVDELRGVSDPGARLRRLAYSDDRAGRFAWKALKKTLLYCAARTPEIAGSIQAVDQAMRWGFNWEMGPFEAWDAIGVRKSVERMQGEGEKVPRGVEKMLAAGRERFYRRREGRQACYDFSKAGYADVEEKPRIILLPSLEERERVVRSNASASLLDMGDGVVCLQFTAAGGVIDDDVVRLVRDGLAEVEANFEGMVIGHQGPNFSLGVDVKRVYALAAGRDWKALEEMIRAFQDACMGIKYSAKPVVVAPHRMALGGGCELCLSAGAVRAHADVCLGLPELGLGLVPGGGGTKEMLLRATEGFPAATPSAVPGGGRPDLIPYVALAFQTVATGQTSTSAREAKGLRFMRAGDPITMKEDHLLYDARQTVLSLVREGYLPPRPRDDIRVIGRSGRAMLDLMVFLLRDAGYITDTDAHLARRLAFVMSGGDVDLNTLVTEQYLLDVEREAILSLAGEERSQARLKSMAETGKLLHN